MTRYHPPDASTIKRYVKEVCEQLAAEHGDAAYQHPEVISGLTSYLNLTAQLLAKCLNEGQHDLLDKPDDRG